MAPGNLYYTYGKLREPLGKDILSGLRFFCVGILIEKGSEMKLSEQAEILSPLLLESRAPQSRVCPLTKSS